MEWWEGNKRHVSARRPVGKRGKGRDNIRREAPEEADAGAKPEGGSAAGTLPDKPAFASSVESRDGRGSGEGGGDGSAAGIRSVGSCACVGCNWTALEVQAFQKLGGIGRTFATELKTNRVEAFENMVTAVAENMALFAFSRSLGLDSQFKMYMQAHTMIGAPKKKSETVEEKPLEALRDWLNGVDVPGFDVNVALPLVPALTAVDEEGEDEDEDEEDGSIT